MPGFFNSSGNLVGYASGHLIFISGMYAEDQSGKTGWTRTMAESLA